MSSTAKSGAKQQAAAPTKVETLDPHCRSQDVGRGDNANAVQGGGGALHLELDQLRLSIDRYDQQVRGSRADKSSGQRAQQHSGTWSYLKFIQDLAANHFFLLILQIVRLLNERMAVCEAIGKAKDRYASDAGSSSPENVYKPAREQAVLQKVLRVLRCAVLLFLSQTITSRSRDM